MRDILKTEDEKNHAAKVKREKLFERIGGRRIPTLADYFAQFNFLIEHGEMIEAQPGEIYSKLYGDINR